MLYDDDIETLKAIRENITPRGDGNPNNFPSVSAVALCPIRENITPRGDGNSLNTF
ncbi:hypothetical protein ACW0TE_03790 [Fusobacterium polymorphum]